MPSTPIYQLRPPDVYPALETCSSGLSSVEADQRLALFGLNLLSEAQRPMPLRRLLGYLGYPLALALLATGLGAAVLGQLFLGLAIWALVLVNTAFSFWRNYRAEQAIDALRRLLPEYTRIFRDGQELHIPANRLVPGDVLVLGEGDNIPADARVVEEFGLRTNDTTLTGDAMPSRKTADASLRDGISELERPNLVFAGTSVVSGTGRAVVYSTGMLTQFGRIAHLTQTVSEAPSPMQVELQDFLRKVSWIAGGFALLVVLVGVLDAEVDLENLDAVLLGLGILVAAIPEGLPATLTLAMALAGQRLALKGVLVKKLSVLETLGTVSTLCTDKSGTLTQNQMTVRELWVAGQALQVSGVGYAPLGRIQPEPAGQPFESSLRQLLLALQACNNSRLTAPAAGKPSWGYIGDQTEAALRAAAVKGGVSEAELQRLPRVHELPFDARRKRMTTIHEPAGADAPARLAYVKGAPRELLAVCTQVLVDGQPQPLDEARRREALEQIDRCAGQALRVLGCACRRLPAGLRAYTPEAVERELTFLGLAAMHDPPRPEVTQAIGVLRQAGIRLIMVTGDYGLTALSLAQRVGMLGSQVQIVTGAELDLLDEAQLKELLGRPELLFARMAPEHKLRLVATLQLMGEVVAVTGDGVNDAPARRKADVGISRGIGGT
ncbi:MAG: cation-translocating P-type ATPase, partial [Chloroflexota bacterium]